MYAVFPLNIVVLPEECVALHLFEPRYRQLFQDHKSGEQFVILFQENGKRSEYGTLVHIDKIVNEFPDETVDIIVKGDSIVRVEDFLDLYPNKLYSAVEAEERIVSNDIDAELKILFDQYISISGKRKAQSSSIGLFQIANRLELSTDIKDQLIALENGKAMNRFLINQIKFMNKIIEQEGLLNQNFHLN